jgi:hypothetical protein
MNGPAEDYNRDAHKNVNDAASEQNDGSSDEDDFGPSLPPREDNRSYQDHEAHTDSYSTGDSLNPSVDNDPSYGKKNQRDEWMVLPPDKSSWVSNIDPTSLRNRKFTTGRSVRNSQGDNSGIGSSWTETPAEKKIRLENEIMGIQAPPEKNSHGTSGRPSKNDSTTADKIRQFNVSVSQGAMGIIILKLCNRAKKGVPLFMKPINTAAVRMKRTMTLVHDLSIGKRTFLVLQM